MHGDYYGTPKHPDAGRIWQQARDVLLEIDVQGALQVRYQYPDALMIFILPPDEPTLLQRLQQPVHASRKTRSKSDSVPPSVKSTWPRAAGRSITW